MFSRLTGEVEWSSWKTQKRETVPPAMRNAVFSQNALRQMIGLVRTLSKKTDCDEQQFKHVLPEYHGETQALLATAVPHESTPTWRRRR